MVIDSCLTIHASELSTREWDKLFDRLTFMDAKENEVTAFQTIARNGTVRFPRGAWALIPDKDYEVVRDLRTRPSSPALHFTRTLDAEGHTGQQEAVQSMLEHQQGVVLRQPGSGKTLTALAFAAKCGTPTLVVVHTHDIFQQWVDYAKAATPDAVIGEIRGKICRIGDITIATVQTLKRYIGEGRGFWGAFGCLFVDEVHHVSAQTYEWILNACPAFYRFGFTATLKRADGWHPYITILIGPVIHEQKFAPRVPTRIEYVPSGFRFDWRGPYDYSPMLDALVRDDERNAEIAQIADRELRAGHSVLILSRRLEHLVRIKEQMDEPAEYLIGTSPRDAYSKQAGLKKPNPERRQEIVQEFREGKIRCLLSTQLADEALDVPRLDRVILAHPGKAEGRIIQQVGRAVRSYPDKSDAIIYDVTDELVTPLLKQAAERRRAYRALGIQKGGVLDAKAVVGRIIRRSLRV